MIGDPPSPRSGHTALALDERYLLVFGGGYKAKDTHHSGVSILDTATWTWSTPRLSVRTRNRMKGLSFLGVTFFCRSSYSGIGVGVSAEASNE